MDKKLIKLIEDNNIQLHGDIEYFAELVAAAEREACARVCDALADEFSGDPDEAWFFQRAAAAIRARGE